MGPLLGLSRHGDVRAVALFDLALVPGLLLARPRWPWVAARAGGNVVIAGLCLRRARDRTDPRRARMAAAALAGVTVLDGSLARDLRRSAR